MASAGATVGTCDPSPPSTSHCLAAVTPKWSPLQAGGERPRPYQPAATPRFAPALAELGNARRRGWPKGSTRRRAALTGGHRPRLARLAGGQGSRWPMFAVDNTHGWRAVDEGRRGLLCSCQFTATVLAGGQGIRLLAPSDAVGARRLAIGGCLDRAAQTRQPVGAIGRIVGGKPGGGRKGLDVRGRGDSLRRGRGLGKAADGGSPAECPDGARRARRR